MQAVGPDVMVFRSKFYVMMALLTRTSCTPRRSTFPASRYQARAFSIRRRKHASPPRVIYSGLEIISATQRIAFHQALHSSPLAHPSFSATALSDGPPDRGSIASPQDRAGTNSQQFLSSTRTNRNCLTNTNLGPNFSLTRAMRAVPNIRGSNRVRLRLHGAQPWRWGGADFKDLMAGKSIT